MLTTSWITTAESDFGRCILTCDSECCGESCDVQVAFGNGKLEIQGCSSKWKKRL